MTDPEQVAETPITDVSFALQWDKRTVPLEAIERAAYALADQVTGVVTDAEEGWRLDVYCRAPGADLDQLAHRLRQEVNDQALRLKIAERTEPIRNLVFALAYSRSGLVERGGGQ
jgi:His-Xaa-Ser system protein HxsD